MTCIKEGDVVVCINPHTQRGPRPQQAAIVAAVEMDELAFMGHVGFFPAIDYTIYAHAPETPESASMVGMWDALKYIKAWNDSHTMHLNIAVEAHPVQEGGTQFVLGDYFDTSCPVDVVNELAKELSLSDTGDLLRMQQQLIELRLARRK